MNRRFHLLWLSLFMLGTAGCMHAGSSFLPLLLTGLLVTFGSIACKSDDECSGSLITSCSEDGELVESCCPAGAACNYVPYTQCPDGSCVQTLDPIGQPDLCPGADAGSSDTTEPTDTAVEPDTTTVEPDTTTVEPDTTTVEPDTTTPTDTGCDGEWQTVCADNALTQDCCAAGLACNYMPYEVCEDGSCAIEMDGESCPGDLTDTGSAVDTGSTMDAGAISDPGSSVDAGCDGEWMTACNDTLGQLADFCCPAGVACNYMPYILCDDGSCVTDMMGDAQCPEPPKDAGPEPTDEGCDGQWNDYCDLDTNTIAQGCCPAGAICNYIPFTLCDDGSCVGFDQECLPAQ